MGRELAEVSGEGITAKDYDVMDSADSDSRQKPFAATDENCGAKKSPQVKSASLGNVRRSHNNGLPKSSTEPDHYIPKNSEPNSPKDSKCNSEEDENMSLASSTGTFGTSKFKVTVGTAPNFRIYERIERRKEFNTKMEQKLAAVEAEKLQQQQRLMEEQQAQIKEMRKNLYVKAKPVPSFYYEPPPPKPQLKKLPLTRPKSPKLTRRRSCGDASNMPHEEKGFCCSHLYRRSLGGSKAESGPFSSSSTRNKSKVGRNTNRSCKTKDQRDQDKETEKTVEPNITESKITEQSNGDIAGES